MATDEFVIVLSMNAEGTSTKVNGKEAAPPHRASIKSIIVFLVAIFQLVPKKAWLLFEEWMTHFNHVEGKILRRIRGCTVLAGIFISGGCLALTLNPPGGVTQFGDVGKVLQYGPQNITCTEPGVAILGIVHPGDFDELSHINKQCFYSSISVVVLNSIGLPLDHWFPAYFTTMGMTYSVSCPAFLYLKAVSLITPSEVWRQDKGNQKKYFEAWVTTISVVASLLSIRFVILIWISLHRLWITLHGLYVRYSNGDNPF